MQKMEQMDGCLVNLHCLQLDVVFNLNICFKKFSFLFGGNPHLNMFMVGLYCTHGCTGEYVHGKFF